MTWPVPSFANLAAGNQPLSLFDQMFAQVALMAAIPCTATGQNAITLTPQGNAPVLTAYAFGDGFRFKAVASSNALVTIGQTGLSLVNAYKKDGSTRISSGDIVSGQEYLAVYDPALNAGAGGVFIEDAAQATGGGGASPGLAFPSGMRLTFATLTPVMSANVTGATSHFFTPYLNQFVPLNVSGTMVMTNVGGELSQLATDTTKSPAAVGANQAFNIYAWNDGGVFRATRGPAWTNDTTPGAGNALTRIQGVWTNTNPITNGPGSNAGTYVGTIRSNGVSTFDWIYGAVGANGVAGWFGLWNQYNRRYFESFSSDTTASWTYNAVAPRAANASNTMRTTFVQGPNPEDMIWAEYWTCFQITAADGALVGIGFDSTTAYSTGMQDRQTNVGAVFIEVGRSSAFFTGVHFAQALESAPAGTPTFFGGTAGVTGLVTGMFYGGWH